MFFDEELEAALRSFPKIGKDEQIRYFTLTSADEAFLRKFLRSPPRSRGQTTLRPRRLQGPGVQAEELFQLAGRRLRGEPTVAGFSLSRQVLDRHTQDGRAR
ncbi:hypothetical protein [Streptomyces sp. NPDC051677]|uniref:hypothetical protein n=1 Tax=Streptomyces sp. NPDC051677 TaxID=3365669 RepID=UPI0037D30FF3